MRTLSDGGRVRAWAMAACMTHLYLYANGKDVKQTVQQASTYCVSFQDQPTLVCAKDCQLLQAAAAGGREQDHWCILILARFRLDTGNTQRRLIESYVRFNPERRRIYYLIETCSTRIPK